MVAFLAGTLYLTSCYNNKYDVLSLPKVSFVNEVVPIMISGACGCHNLEGATNITQFSDGHGEVFYDAILGRAQMMGKWAKGEIAHPGGGVVILTQRDKTVINDWIAQGAKSDYEPPVVGGDVTFAVNIAPMIKSTCSGGSCHGGSAKTLDYATMTTSNNINNLTKMGNSNGSSGHPGGSISLSNTVSKMILNWITQGTKQ